MKRDEKVHVSYLEIFASKKQQETPQKKHIQHSPSSSKNFAYFLQAQALTFDENLLSRFEVKKHTINHWPKPKRQGMKSSKRKWWWVLSFFQPKHKHTTFKLGAQVV